MPSYALLGATGSTGSNILKTLNARPDAEIHALVRSRRKLEAQMGDRATPHLTVYEGSMSDIELLKTCIAGTHAVFITLGPPGNEPGCTIVQDAVQHVIAALREIAATSPSTKLPRIIMLSSSSLDDHLNRHEPRFFHKILLTGVHHTYADIGVAERLLRAESGWISSTFMKPGGLVHDEPKGHELTTDRAYPWTSFADLAGAMVELADEEGDRWDQKNVSVRPKSAARIGWSSLWTLAKGLVNYYLPWTYQYFH
ncbi:NADH(P)-binding-domain-containing protein [Xylariomycetidae sp. FL2044]|nr:NADH(P)-binding-domain-containing protein [Xylariomycetidae sp. FL2044]